MNRTVSGIVVKEIPYGDSGKLLSVLTADEGILVVKATGARNIKSSYLRSVQLFAYSDMTVYEKNGRLTLTEASLKENFFGLRSDVLVLALASYIADLSAITAVPTGDDGILRLLLNSLYVLSRRMADVDLVKAVFEYRLCVAMGIEPDFSACEICGEKPMIYDFTDNSSYCEKCAPEGHKQVMLPRGAIDIANYLGSCDTGRIFSFAVDTESQKAFELFAEEYITYVGELHTKTLDYFINIRNSLR